MIFLVAGARGAQSLPVVRLHAALRPTGSLAARKVRMKGARDGRGATGAALRAPRGGGFLSLGTLC